MDKDKNIAIRVDNVSKIYRLYNKPSDRLKEALGVYKGKEIPGTQSPGSGEL